MEKKVKDLERGDKIERLNGDIAIVLRVITDVDKEEYATIFFKDGSRYFCLTDESVEILQP
jgi:hypothetical protein